MRKEFEFNNQYKQTAADSKTKLKALFNASQTVGLHVRRGDFLAHGHQEYGYNVAPREYFTNAIKWFTDRFGKNIVFLVASDDLDWCKQNLDFQGAQHVMSGSATAMDDFAMLVSADHHIISVGSYGWWAAYLGGGHVVYYRDWPRPGSPHASHHNPTDYYFWDWHPLV